MQLAEQFRAFGAGMTLRVRAHDAATRHAGKIILRAGAPPALPRQDEPARPDLPVSGRAAPPATPAAPNARPRPAAPAPARPRTPVLKDCVIIGGVEQQQQAKALARRPHVVVATPGRLAELVDTDASLKKGFARTR